MNLLRPRLVAASLAIFIIVASAGTSCAHDVWLTFSGSASARRVIVNYGHPHDRPPAFADKLLDLQLISSGKQESLIEGLAPARSHGAIVAASRPFADDGHNLFAARYDNGYWVKIADKVFRNATKRLAPDALECLWSGKFAKAVTGPGAPWDKVAGHEMEIMPLSDPAAVRPGETLRVRVLFKGKPLAGGEVERGDGVTPVKEEDIPKFKTDAEGVASIPIVARGAHLLVIDHQVTPSATPDAATKDLYNATLWFSTRAGRGRGGRKGGTP
jgi:nickel transport protein